MFTGPLAQRTRRSQPFEVRMAQSPSDDTDVFGPTMSRHSTLAAAREWRQRYYQSCLAQQVTPASLVIVEVRHNCVVRYVGSRAIAVYREGGECRTEDLRRERRFSVESVIDTLSGCSAYEDAR